MYLPWEHRVLYNSYLQMQRTQMKMNRFHASLLSISSKYIAFATLHIYICNYINILASIISVFLHNSETLRKDTKLSLQNICHTMPHKTLIGAYLFIIIFDKKIHQMLFGGHFFLN